MAYTMREEEKLDGIERMKNFFSVQLGGRGKGCLAKVGRTQHERRMHQIPNKQEFVSEMQKKTFTEKQYDESRKNMSRREPQCISSNAKSPT